MVTTSLRARSELLVQQVLGSDNGSWLVWCDPRGDWLPLLQRVSGNAPGGFELVSVDKLTAGEIGGPGSRHELLARLDAQASFVL